MPKIATEWSPTPTGTSSPDNEGDFLLLENGDNLLLENGDDFLLEGSVVTIHEPIDWDEVAKEVSSWKPADSGTSVEVTDSLVTEAGDARITEQGDIRILEGSDVSTKPLTQWDEN